MDKPERNTHRTWAVLALALGSLTAFGCTATGDLGDDGAAGTAEAPGPPGAPRPLDTVLAPYETVRQALLEDKLEGIAEAAADIRDAGKTFMEEPHEAMPAAELSALEALIPSLVSAAGELAQAGDIAVARASFWALTESLMKYRELYADDEVRVAYCPMAQKSWLQPDGEIGNPYYGQSMAECGGFVDGQGDGHESTG